MILANARTDIHEAILAAHTVAYKAVSLFGEHHKLKDGRHYTEPEPTVSCGRPITHGVFNNSLDFISLSTLVVGARLNTQCRCSMKETNVSEIRKLLNKGFVANKDWRIGDVRVSVKSFMEPILAFLNRYKEQVEVYVGLYENKATYTEVLGLVITSKHNRLADRLTWEITIADADLIFPLSVSGLFCRK